MVSPSPDSQLPPSTPVKQVLVVPRNQLQELFETDPSAELLLRHGIQQPRDKSISHEAAIAGIFSQSFFTPRAPAETNPDLKQIIPYVVVTNRQGDVLSYTRGKAGQEDRLHALRSIGFGGHIDLEDRDNNLLEMLNQNESAPEVVKNQVVNFRAFQAGVDRELKEELDIHPGANTQGKPFVTRSACLGVINNDLDAVGQVHIGVLFVLEIVQYESIVADHSEGIEGLQWIPFEQLGSIEVPSLEAWSAIALPEVAEFLKEMRSMTQLIDVLEDARNNTQKMEAVVDFFRRVGLTLEKARDAFKLLQVEAIGATEAFKLCADMIASIDELNSDDKSVLDHLREARDTDLQPTQGPGGVAGRTAPAADDGVSYPQTEDDLDEPLPQRQGNCDGETCESCQ